MAIPSDYIWLIDLLRILSPIIAIGLFIWRCSGWISNLKQILEKLSASVSTIETAITRVDLKTMEIQLATLIGMATPSKIGNTVHTTLEKSGVALAVSLASRGSQSEIEMRFDQAIELSGLKDKIIEDKELEKIEKVLFNSQVTILRYSPMGLKFVIKSDDLDSIARWVRILLDKLDDFLIDLVSYEEEFDKKLEALL